MEVKNNPILVKGLSPVLRSIVSIQTRAALYPADIGPNFCQTKATKRTLIELVCMQPLHNSDRQTVRPRRMHFEKLGVYTRSSGRPVSKTDHDEYQQKEIVDHLITSHNFP